MYYCYNSLIMVIPASKEKSMIFPLYKKENFLPVLVSRTVIFFFLMCLLTLFLYAVGTIQGFIDSTQLSLLRLYGVLGIFLTVTSVYGTILFLRRFFTIKKKRYLFRAGGYLFLTIFGVATVLTVMFIVTVSAGNGA